MKRNRLTKRLRGYLKADRERFFLLSRGELTQEEFLLYELCIAITDWDDKHDEYGTFQATNRELSELLGWKSDTSAGRHKHNLIKKGFLLRNNDESLKPIDFEKWQLRKTSAKMQDISSNIHFPNANKHNSSSFLQENRAQRNGYSLVSSKGRNSLSDKKIPSSSLSTEDIDWINKQKLS